MQSIHGIATEKLRSGFRLSGTLKPSSRQRKALLIDEYGEAAGIVTVADVAATLIADDKDIRLTEDGRFVVAGDVSIDTVEAVLSATL